MRIVEKVPFRPGNSVKTWGVGFTFCSLPVLHDGAMKSSSKFGPVNKDAVLASLKLSRDILKRVENVLS